MSREVIFTIGFLDSLYTIKKFIQTDSNQRAEDFVNFTKNRIDNLKLFPKLGIYIENELYIYQFDKTYYLSYFIKGDKIYLLFIGHVKLKIRK